MSEWKEYDLGNVASFRYGKMTEVKMTGKYPVHSGYRIVGYTNEANYQKGKAIIVARGVEELEMLRFYLLIAGLRISVSLLISIIRLLMTSFSSTNIY